MTVKTSAVVVCSSHYSSVPKEATLGFAVAQLVNLASGNDIELNLQTLTNVLYFSTLIKTLVMLSDCYAEGHS
jgi:hypothetical protein